jgi:predicted small secreted protein
MRNKAILNQRRVLALVVVLLSLLLTGCEDARLADDDMSVKGMNGD